MFWWLALAEPIQTNNANIVLNCARRPQNNIYANTKTHTKRDVLWSWRMFVLIDLELNGQLNEQMNEYEVAFSDVLAVIVSSAKIREWRSAFVW